MKIQFEIVPACRVKHAHLFKEMKEGDDSTNVSSAGESIDRSPSNPYLDSKLKKIDHDNIDNILDGILEDPRGDGV